MSNIHNTDRRLNGNNNGIVLLGGGGHCASVLDILSLLRLDVYGVVDPNADSAQRLNVGYLGDDDSLEAIRKHASKALVTVGQIKTPKTRIALFSMARNLGFEMITLISPLSHIAHNASVGTGTAIMHHCIINSNTFIGENCIINTKSLIEHDCEVGPHSHVAVGAIIAGGVRIGEGSFIGAGAVVGEGITIGERCIIGMGCIVRNDLKEGTLYTQR